MLTVGVEEVGRQQMGEGEEGKQQLQKHLAGCSTVVAADSIGSTAAGRPGRDPVVWMQPVWLEAVRLQVLEEGELEMAGWQGEVEAWLRPGT